MENNQKPKVNPKKGVIYVVRTSKTVDNIFKIGISKKFMSRLLSHNSIEPDDIEILLLYETNNITQVENCVKNSLKSKQYRKRKEINQVDLDTVKEVIEDCDDILCKVANSKKTKSKLKIINNKKLQNLFMLFIEKKLEDEKKPSKKHLKIVLNQCCNKYFFKSLK